MKEIKFDMNEASFDHFHRFYIWEKGFVRFENGETCYTRTRPDPDQRGHFPDFGVTIFTLNDSFAPTIYDPESGEKIPAGQLVYTGSSPYLLWDMDRNMVVELSRKIGKDRRLPKQIRNIASCYWAAHDSDPLADPLTYYPPNKLTKEQKEYVSTFPDVVPTVLALRHDDNSPSLINTTPTLDDIQKAIENDESPLVFLNKFSPGVLFKLKDAPISNLPRKARVIPYGVVKK